jgi:hypothetical protein
LLDLVSVSYPPVEIEKSWTLELELDEL